MNCLFAGGVGRYHGRDVSTRELAQNGGRIHGLDRRIVV
jgi:hypothetical protein